MAQVFQDRLVIVKLFALLFYHLRGFGGAIRPTLYPTGTAPLIHGLPQVNFTGFNTAKINNYLFVSSE
jgi:hypothetical protein